MKIAVLLSKKDIAAVDESRAARAKICGGIIHPGFELGELIAEAKADTLRPILAKVREDKSPRDQVGWRISSKAHERLVELSIELKAANLTEVIRSIIMARHEELSAQKTCGPCELCSANTPLDRPDRFTLAAFVAKSEGNILDVKALADKIVSEKADCVVVFHWSPALLGSAELLRIVEARNYDEYIENYYRPEASEPGFLLLFRLSRYRYPAIVSGEVPGSFFPISIHDMVANKEQLIIAAIEGEETQEDRINDLTRRFQRTKIITVRADDITPVSGVGVKILDNSDDFLKAEITYI